MQGNKYEIVNVIYTYFTTSIYTYYYYYYVVVVVVAVVVVFLCGVIFSSSVVLEGHGMCCFRRTCYVLF